MQVGLEERASLEDKRWTVEVTRQVFACLGNRISLEDRSRSREVSLVYGGQGIPRRQELDCGRVNREGVI